jgi:hypothetical protein
LERVQKVGEVVTIHLVELMGPLIVLVLVLLVMEDAMVLLGL